MLEAELFQLSHSRLLEYLGLSFSLLWLWRVLTDTLWNEKERVTSRDPWIREVVTCTSGGFLTGFPLVREVLSPLPQPYKEIGYWLHALSVLLYLLYPQLGLCGLQR